MLTISEILFKYQFYYSNYPLFDICYVKIPKDIHCMSSFMCFCYEIVKEFNPKRFENVNNRIIS